MKKNLRIGILLENDIVPAWAYEMFSNIDRAPGSAIVLYIQQEEKVKSGHGHYLYDVYSKLDRKYFKSSPDAFALKSVTPLLNVDVLPIAESQKIKDFNLDILIQLRQDELPEEILNASKYGVWHYHFGETKKTEDTPDIFWEVIERRGEVGLTLVMKKANQEQILATSYSLTDNLSVERTKNSYFWKAVTMLPNTIDQLYKLGEEVFFDRSNKLTQKSTFFFNQINSIPTNRNVVLKLAKFKWKRLQNILTSFFYFDQWILLFNFDHSETLFNDFSKFKKIVPPKDRFWADPHVIKKNEKYYIFIEELIYSQNKGFISVIEMDNQGNYKPPVVILDKEYHLSFPFLFEEDGNLYMIPESKQNSDIQLYKCVDFPFKWEFETVLMDHVKAVDTVVTKKDGTYWLFTNMVKNKGASFYDELYLYSSDNLISNSWKPHPENPIVSDVKNARMAGKLFELGNRLLRPSQNCSNHYGYGMHINQVIEMNEESYNEETIQTLNPNWDKNIISMHSLTNADGLTVIDAELRRRK